MEEKPQYVGGRPNYGRGLPGKPNAPRGTWTGAPKPLPEESIKVVNHIQLKYARKKCHVEINVIRHQVLLPGSPQFETYIAAAENYIRIVNNFPLHYTKNLFFIKKANLNATHHFKEKY